MLRGRKSSRGTWWLAEATSVVEGAVFAARASRCRVTLLRPMSRWLPMGGGGGGVSVVESS